jgi:hypothetical protein
VLGETLQLEKDDGSKFYAEAILAEPPTAAFLLVGPENIYRVFGYFEVLPNHFSLSGLRGDPSYFHRDRV